MQSKRAAHRAAMLTAVLASVTAYASASGTPGRYFDVVNATHDSATRIAVAPAGSGQFRDIDIGAPLRGGNTWTTVQIEGGDCLRDFRVQFQDGRTLLYRDIDVCRHHRLKMTPRDSRPHRD